VRDDSFGAGYGGGFGRFGYGGGFGRFGSSFGIGFGFGRPYYSRFGYYRDPFFYGWDDPFWAGRGIDVYTEYRSQLEMDIRERATNRPLFEGRAQARSTTDELGRLVPSLIEAMFVGFPGQNGETVRISIPDRPRQR